MRFIFKIIYPITFFVGILFLAYNYNFLFNKNNSYFSLLIVIFFNILHHLNLNIRSYVILKLKFIKSIDLISWSKNFHSSVLFQETIIQHSAIIIKSIYLKSFNIDNNKLLSFFYYGLVTHLLVNVFFVLIEINLLAGPSFDIVLVQTILFILVLLIIYFLPILISSIISSLKLKIINNRINLFIQNIANNQKFLFLDKKIFFFMFLSTSLTHFLEISVFYFLHQFLNFDIDLYTVVILFGLGIFADRIPIFSSIPFVREFIFGFMSSFFGISFTDGFLLKSLMRITAIFSSIFHLSWITSYQFIKLKS